MKTIAVIFGGRSAEHDVSIVTAIGSVIKPLGLTKKYHVLPIYISKQGEWYAGEKFGDIKLYSTGKITNVIAKTKPVVLDINNGLTIIRPGIRDKRIHIDVAFPALHGTYGEDGSVMGLLRMANVPYVGCGLEASVIAMNKLLSHQVVAAWGLKGHPYKGVSKERWSVDKDGVLMGLSELQLPLFVKPVHLGSSIGITRVTQVGDLAQALDTAFSYDDMVIAEEAIPNLIEVTVPVMGPNNDPTVGLVERPLINNGETFDFDKKYIGQGKMGGKKMAGAKGAQGYSELPAKLEQKLYAECEAVARNVYKLLGCDGIARVDLLIDSKTSTVYFNEINPMPGSLYAHNWSRAGISTVQLVDRLVERAQDVATASRSVTTTFDTNFLKQF